MGDLDDLEHLANLRKSGIISEAEFDAKKKEILAGIGARTNGRDAGCRCPECQGRVSERSRWCPRCGCRLRILPGELSPARVVGLVPYVLWQTSWAILAALPDSYFPREFWGNPFNASPYDRAAPYMVFVPGVVGLIALGIAVSVPRARSILRSGVYWLIAVIMGFLGIMASIGLWDTVR